MPPSLSARRRRPAPGTALVMRGGRGPGTRPSGSRVAGGWVVTVRGVDRRGFLLAVGVGTFGVLTACQLSAAESGTALPAPPTPAPTAAEPSPVTPVPQHGAPAVSRIPPPGTVVSWVPDTPPLVALTIDDGVSSPVVGG